MKSKLKYINNRENQKFFISLLKVIRENIALVQHHDAVTGTSTNDVAHDYISRLNESIKLAKEIIGIIINNNNNQGNSDSSNSSTQLDENNICLISSTEFRCLNKIYDLSNTDTKDENKDTILEIINLELEGTYPFSIKIYNNTNTNSFKIYQNNTNNIDLRPDIICDEHICTVYFFIEFSKKHIIEKLIIQSVKETNENNKSNENNDNLTRNKTNNQYLQSIKLTNDMLLFENDIMRINFDYEKGFEYYIKKSNHYYTFII